MAKYRITQIISSNGETRRQKDNLRCLGIRRMPLNKPFKNLLTAWVVEG